MTERYSIEFPDKRERYDSDRDVVLFSGRTTRGEISCAISREALVDYCEIKGKDRRALLSAFRKYRQQIENIARKKVSARQLEPDGSLLIRNEDMQGRGS